MSRKCQPPWYSNIHPFIHPYHFLPPPPHSMLTLQEVCAKKAFKAMLSFPHSSFQRDVLPLLSCQKSLLSLCVLLKSVIGVVSFGAIRTRGKSCLSAVCTLIDVRNNFTLTDILIKLVKFRISQGVPLACQCDRRSLCVVCLVRNAFRVISEERILWISNFVSGLKKSI
jgi:hypothetical protein